MSDQKRGGRGTHGSLSKAGRVREITPRVPRTSTRRSPGPRVSNGKAYQKSLNPPRRYRRRRR